MNKKTQKIIMVAALIVLLLGVGYATFNTNLSIEGTTEIVNNNFVVKFANITEKEGSVTATTPATLTNDTTLTFNATLSNPGEYYSFSIEIVNEGFLDAMIESITMTELTEQQKKYLEFKVTDEYGSKLNEKELLKKGDSRLINVLLMYKNEPEEYPSSGTESLSISLDINFVEADETAIEVETHVNMILGNRFLETYVNATNRATAETNIYLESGVTISLINPSKYNYGIAAQSSSALTYSDGYVSGSGWQTASYTTTTAGWYGFTFKRTDDADFALGTTDSNNLYDYIKIN